MSTEDSAADTMNGNPFPHSTTREALASRIDERSYFKERAVTEAGCRAYYLLGYVGEYARKRALNDGRKTVKVRDVIDAIQIDLPVILQR